MTQYKNMNNYYGIRCLNPFSGARFLMQNLVDELSDAGVVLVDYWKHKEYPSLVLGHAPPATTTCHFDYCMELLCEDENMAAFIKSIIIPYVESVQFAEKCYVADDNDSNNTIDNYLKDREIGFWDVVFDIINIIWRYFDV